MKDTLIPSCHNNNMAVMYSGSDLYALQKSLILLQISSKMGANFFSVQSLV
jgi:hypothetical protein